MIILYSYMYVLQYLTEKMKNLDIDMMQFVVHPILISPKSTFDLDTN